MFHLNVHQWVTSAEEGLNNQVHETIPCEDTSRPLSLTLFSLPDGLPNKVATSVRAGSECPRCRHFYALETWQVKNSIFLCVLII